MGAHMLWEGGASEGHAPLLFPKNKSVAGGEEQQGTGVRSRGGYLSGHRRTTYSLVSQHWPMAAVTGFSVPPSFILQCPCLDYERKWSILLVGQLGKPWT